MAELTSAGGGEPVSIVHVTAEYFPYARTGGDRKSTRLNSSH